MDSPAIDNQLAYEEKLPKLLLNKKRQAIFMLKVLYKIFKI